jgi:uncharacterized protein YdaU (DUF1376 family)
MRSVLVVMMALLFVTSVLAQTPIPEDQRSKELYRLDLRYAEENWKACRVQVVDFWERGNALEQENQRLRGEIAKLKAAPGLEKDKQNAPPAN